MAKKKKPIKKKAVKKKAAPKKKTRQSRIVGHGKVDPKTIKKHAANWREHPPAQKESLANILNIVGYVDDVIINKTTGNLLDGHLRVDDAIEHKVAKIDVKYVEVSEEEELVILQTFDAIGMMARTNQSKLDELTSANESLLGEVKEQVAEMLDYVEFVETSANVYDASPEEVFDDGEEVDENLIETTPDRVSPVIEIAEPISFEIGKTAFDIPPLRGNFCEPPSDIQTWITAKDHEDAEHDNHWLTILGNGNIRTLPWEKTILCTHTRDEELDAVWDSLPGFTRRLMSRKPFGVMSPEFSVYRDMPKAERIWSTYKNRYVGRMWQEAGLSLLPTVSNIWHEKDAQFLYSGIPKNVPCVSVQMQNTIGDGNDKLGKEDRQIAHFRIVTKTIIDKLAPQSLLIYGGSGIMEIVPQLQLPKELHVIPVTNWSTGRNAYRKANQKRKQNLGD